MAPWMEYSSPWVGEHSSRLLHTLFLSFSIHCDYSPLDTEILHIPQTVPDLSDRKGNRQ